MNVIVCPMPASMLEVFDDILRGLGGREGFDREVAYLLSLDPQQLAGYFRGMSQSPVSHHKWIAAALGVGLMLTRQIDDERRETRAEAPPSASPGAAS